MQTSHPGSVKAITFSEAFNIPVELLRHAVGPLHCATLSREENYFADCHLCSDLRGLEENPRTMGCHGCQFNIKMMHSGFMT